VHCFPPCWTAHSRTLVSPRSLFRLLCAASVPGVEPHLLYPFKTWRNKSEFDQTARKLVSVFHDNFLTFETQVEAEVRAAAPAVRLAAE
jgi:phosphoenolpyruvate carboxykinase (ATP)